MMPMYLSVCNKGAWQSDFSLTGVRDGEAVGRFQVVDVIVEVKGFLRRILVGVVQLNGEPEGAVLLHRGAHK